MPSIAKIIQHQWQD